MWVSEELFCIASGYKSKRRKGLMRDYQASLVHRLLVQSMMRRQKGGSASAGEEI